MKEKGMKESGNSLSHDAATEIRTNPEDGVDVTLVRWTLSLTPGQRLRLLQTNADALSRLRDAAEAQR